MTRPRRYHPAVFRVPYIRRATFRILCWALMGIAFCVPMGCTLTTFDPVLTSTLSGLTLDQLQSIQSDERLTAAERRTAVRDALGLSDTDEGNRLADFLLNLTLP